jgi:hypothetical protein
MLNNAKEDIDRRAAEKGNDEQNNGNSDSDF